MKESHQQVSDKRGKSWKREREEWRKPEPGNQAANHNRRDEDKSVSHRLPPLSSHESPPPCDADARNASEFCEEQLEAEKERREAERLVEEERLRQSKEDDERKWIMDYAKEDQNREDAREKLRQRNLSAAEHRPEESDFRKLDSTLKKTTAFIRKLRNFTEQQSVSIADEMKTLNLSKYMGEVASALVEAKLKLTDIPAAIELASLLHQRYADFGQQFQENWVKALAMKREDKTVANPSKLRVDLRFYADAVAYGLLSLRAALPILGNVLTTLVTMDKDSKLFNNISVLLSFCKHCGKDYAGLVPKRVKTLSARFGVPVSVAGFLPPEKQKNVRNLLKDYYATLAKHLVESQKELNAFEKATRKMLMTRGEVPKDRTDKGEAMKTAHAKILTNVQQLAEVLDEEIPILPAPSFDDDDEAHVDLVSVMDSGYGREEGKDGIWDDEDTRGFYEDLVDLRAFVPSILYRDSEKATSKMPETEEDNLDDELLAQAELEATENEAEAASSAAGGEVSSLAAKTDVGTDSEGGGGGPSGDRLSEDDVSAAALAVLNDADDDDTLVGEDDSAAGSQSAKGAGKKGKPSAANKVLLDAFLTSLPQCISRELMDKAAIKFCMELNTKNNRRKLVRALFSVPRTRQDLLPFYGRLVATLYPCMPDVANDLAHMLKQEFRYQLRKKDQINIETKVKVVRFIAELVKFNMYPKTEALLCLRMLLFDFRHHNIEMACNLLETAGRYLFRCPDSHPRTKLFLEQMMRKKTVQSLESRYETMVENAYYFVNPPDLPAISAQEIELLPPQLLWIKSLIVETLGSATVEKVVMCLRKIEWDDPAVRDFAVRTLAEPFAVKFYNIRFLAGVVGGLLTYQEDVSLRIIDRILDEIRLGLEVNSQTKFFQRRVAAVCYLGELYKVRLVDSSVIFNTLYSLITFGVVPDPSVWNPMDLPDNLFRIKLACQLLSVCGNFFITGSTKKKLLCFMLYFQRYYWQKRDHEIWGENGSRFPVTVSFVVEDMFRDLTPQTPLARSRDEAELAVVEMERELSRQVEAVLPPGLTIDSVLGGGPSSSEAASSTGGGGGGLEAIAEEGDEGAEGGAGADASSNALLDKLRSSVRKAVENAVGSGPGGEESPKTLSLSEGAQDEDEISAAVFDGDDEDEEEGRPRYDAADESEGSDGGSESDDDDDDDEDSEDDDDDSSSDYSEAGEIGAGDASTAAAAEKANKKSKKKKRRRRTTPYQLEDVETRVSDLSSSRVIDCPENEDFVSSFEKLVSESILERSKDAVKPSAVVDISVPYHIRSNNNRKTYEQLQKPEVETSTMKFVLMTRKGNKQQFKDIVVGVDSDLAKNLRSREEVERAEKEHIKRVTLDINERQEQEDYQEMLQAAQRPATVCFHRERKAKYQHPKGAPDADAIFGPKRGVKF